jgi:hypothetical protein
MINVTGGHNGSVTGDAEAELVRNFDWLLQGR